MENNLPRLANYPRPDAIRAFLAPGRLFSTEVLVNGAPGIRSPNTADIASLRLSSQPITVLSLGMRFVNHSAFHDLAKFLPPLQKLAVHIAETANIGTVPKDDADVISRLMLDILPLPQFLHILGLCHVKQYKAWICSSCQIPRINVSVAGFVGKET
ncbi:hypothetical protein CPB83DRAFT_836549 [Crepidotus variabilis]|uniref:Uncharacterized protein n=1 Tax=Crepidotus variabilis TaxID=179855 RepID=A0A9P6JPH6_9AGAR|nr:hypothetical protein CPB83DRAFT_836549 [Crepidotus variabilis]